MDGILVMHKPSGPTSYDVVRLVKRLTRERRVGHGGTLDPLASGVLPVLLGQATRVSEYLLAARKAYRAQVRLGVTTDTYDAAGQVMAQADPTAITRDQVLQALAPFQGVIAQKPPMYSALKHEGKPLYALARAGIEVEREARAVQIYGLALVDWQPPCFTLDIECGRGTYVRSLAHDLGQGLGCGAHLQSLVRTRAGPFRIGDALTIQGLFAASYGGSLQDVLYAMDWALLDLPAAVLSAPEEAAVRYGQQLPADPDGLQALGPGPHRGYGPDGALVALLALDAAAAQWQPVKVFAASLGPDANGPAPGDAAPS